MARSSEEFINSTLSSPLLFVDCLKENLFSYISLYLIKLVCAILGTPAHLWYLQFYLHGSKCKFKPAHVLFLNHSVLELIYCLECVPEILNVFIFKNKMCDKLLFFFFGVSWLGRPLLQTLICIEQYLAVIFPITFLKYKNIKYRIAVAAASWFIAFAYGLYTINLQSFPDPIFNFLFFTAVIVISFCCVSVLYTLKQSSKRISNHTGRYTENQQTQNVFNTILTTLIMILLTYFPQVLLTFLTIIKIDQKLYQCCILPFISAVNTWSVLITALLKMYREGLLKRYGVICKFVK